MIIVRVIGGLGNQMFQYALGRRLADRLHVPLKLDITGFRVYDLHRYSLWALNIREELATDAEVAHVTGGNTTRVRRLMSRAIPLLAAGSRPQIRETTLAFDPRVLEVPDGSYLDGYWQSDKYFAGSQERLRVEFSFRAPLRGQNVEVAEQMRERASVSVHVRRGDYVTNSRTSQVYGVCDAEYYERCIAYVAARIHDPAFFVFSDEPDWARENLHIPYPTTVVSHNDAGHNFEDLRLMSLCDHHIIANSSFSWWGAWLNAEPSKTVLMPKRWFRARSPEATVDIRPEGWIAL